MIYSASGLTGHYARVIAKTKKHYAVFSGNDLIMCSCGKRLDSEAGYRAHLNTKVSYGDTHLVGDKLAKRPPRKK